MTCSWDNVLLGTLLLFPPLFLVHAIPFGLFSKKITKLFLFGIFLAVYPASILMLIIINISCKNIDISGFINGYFYAGVWMNYIGFRYLFDFIYVPKLKFPATRIMFITHIFLSLPILGLVIVSVWSLKSRGKKFLLGVKREREGGWLDLHGVTVYIAVSLFVLMFFFGSVVLN